MNHAVNLFDRLPIELDLERPRHVGLFKLERSQDAVFEGETLRRGRL